MKKASYFFILFVVGILLSGCIPTVGENEPDSNSFEYLKGSVVSGFPQVPLYEKAEIGESYGNKGSYGATFYSKDSIDKVVSYYSSSLTVLGWEVDLASEEEDSVYKFDIKNATNTGEVIINMADDLKTVAVSVFVNPK